MFPEHRWQLPPHPFLRTKDSVREMQNEEVLLKEALHLGVCVVMQPAVLEAAGVALALITPPTAASDTGLAAIPVEYTPLRILKSYMHNQEILG